MFNLLENVEKYHADDNSIDIESMRRDNVERWARGEALEVEILKLAGQMNAVQYRFILLLGEYDNTGCWQGDGIKSFAHWLNWKIGMGMVRSPVDQCCSVLIAIYSPDRDHSFL